MRTKINKLTYISSIFTILVCVFSFSLDKLIVSTTDNVYNLQNVIEETHKREIKNGLISLRSNLQNAIYKNNLNPNNDDEITDWVLNHSNLLSNKYIEKISLVNLGYSAETDKLDMSILLQDVDNLSQDVKNDMIKYSEHINDVDNTLSNGEIVKYIDRMCKEISCKYNMKNCGIRDILLDTLFVKDKVLFSTDDNTITYNNDKYWTESIVIPDGSLGFNNEPVYKNNRENLEYRKIIITVIIDISEVMTPYDQHMKNLNRLCNAANFLLIVLSIGTILFLCINFISILKKYNVGGDTNAEDNRSVCAYINSVLRVIGVRIKQVWNKFRKRN